MEQYISKAAVIAEIRILQERYGKFQPRNICEEGLKEGRLIGYEDALHKLNSLEVKEVDLCKEEERIWKDFNMAECRISKNDLEKISKHFFELGLKAARKGE